MKNQRGMTLLEVVILIAVLGFLAAMVVPFAGALAASQRERTTWEHLREIKKAIIGPEGVYDQKGRRVIKGYAADVGDLPELYKFTFQRDSAGRGSWKPFWEPFNGAQNLETDQPVLAQPRGLWEKPEKRGDHSTKWKGPYLPYPKARFEAKKGAPPLRHSEGVLSDAWGRPLLFFKVKDEKDEDKTWLFIVSLGPEGKIKGNISTPDGRPLDWNAWKNFRHQNPQLLILEINPNEWKTVNVKQEVEETRELLERIKTALMGPEAYDPAGNRLIGGLLGDTGKIALYSWDGTEWKPWKPEKPEDAGEEDAGEVAQIPGLWDKGCAGLPKDPNPGFAWRGPYLPPPPDNLLKDAWGTPLKFQLDKEGNLEIISSGPDRKFFTEDDLILTIKKDEWQLTSFTLSGKIIDGRPAFISPRPDDPPADQSGYRWRWVKEQQGTDEEGNPIYVYRLEPQGKDVSFTLKLYHQPEGKPLSVSSSVYLPGGDQVEMDFSAEFKPEEGSFIPARRRKIDIEITEGSLTPAEAWVYIGPGGTQTPLPERLTFTYKLP